MRALGAFSLFFFAWIAKTETNYRQSVTQTAIAKGIILKPDLFFAFWSSFCRFFQASDKFVEIWVFRRACQRFEIAGS